RTREPPRVAQLLQRNQPAPDLAHESERTAADAAGRTVRAPLVDNLRTTFRSALPSRLERLSLQWKADPVRASEPDMVSADTKSIIHRAKRIYVERLQAVLEPQHRDRFVALEPDSGEYFLGDTFDEA